MKILIFILCGWLAFVASGNAHEKLLIIQTLGVRIPFLMAQFPCIAAIVCFLILTLGIAKKKNESMLEFMRNKGGSIIGRLCPVFIILSLMFIWPRWYFNQKVEKVSIAANDFRDINWQQFQDAIGFKALAISTAECESVYFERSAGRAAKVDKLLLDIHKGAHPELKSQ